MPARKVLTAATVPALEARLVAEVRRLRGNDPLAPLVILVGSNAVRGRVRTVLHRDAKVRAGVRLWTFPDLARHLGEARLLGRGLRRLERPADLLLLEEACADLAALPGAPFAAGARTPGFARALRDTLEDLREAGLAPTDLPADRPRCAHLGALFAAFEKLKAERRCYDTVDLLAEAARVPAQLPDGASALLCHGLYDLTGLQRRLLAHVARAVHVTVLLPLPGANEARRYGEDLHDWLGKQGFESTPAAVPASASDLARLQQHCFATPGASPPAPPPDHTVEITLVPGGAFEMREVARRLLAWHDEKVPFDEMAVVHHGAADGAAVRQGLAAVRLPVAEDAAEGRRVPIRGEAGPTLARTVAGRALLRWLDLRDGDWPRADVIEALGLAPLRVCGGAAPTARFEAAARAAGVVRGLPQWTGRLAVYAADQDRLAAEPARVDADESGAARRRADAARGCAAAVAELSARLQAIPDAGPPGAVIGAVAAALDALLPADGEPVPGHAEVRELLDAMASAAVVTTHLDLRRFVRLLEDALEETSAGSRGGAAGVFVGSVYALRGLAFTRVCLVGLTEHRFPPPARADPLLPDADRQALRDPDHPVPLKVEGRLDEERMLFALALASASERLVLSVPRVDPASGRPLVPSFHVVEALQALTGKAVRAVDRAAWPGVREVALGPLGADARARALDGAEFDLSVAADAGAGGAGLVALAADDDAEGALARALRASEARGRAVFTPWDGCLESPEALAHLAGAGAGAAARSPSRLETFAACPYKFFLRHTLGCEAVEEPADTERMEPAMRGTVVHDALERLVWPWIKAERLPLRDADIPEALRDLDAALDAALAEAHSRGLAGPPVVVGAERQRLRPALHAYVRKYLTDAAWVPVGAEAGFGVRAEASGGPNRAEPVELRLPGGVMLRFRGYIDRVDRAPDGTLRVVDYKTGGVPDPGAVARGEGLQLPVYALAAEALWPGHSVVAADYHPVGPDARRKKPIGLDRAGLADARAALGRIATLVDEHVRRGVVPATPRATTCRTCDFLPACGPGREGLFGRKRRDPRAAEILRMQEPAQ